MALFTTLYSGSSGNCGLVLCGREYLLIDMGKSCRTTLTALRKLDLAVSDCAGILVTHEHSDHIKGLGVISRKHKIPIYCTRGTMEAMGNMSSLGKMPEGLFRPIEADHTVSVG